MPRKKELPVLSGVVMVNNMGKEVPIELVRPEHLKRHSVVNRIVNEVNALQNIIAKSKTKVLRLVDAHEKYMLKVNGLAEDTGLGNITLSNYSNTARVVIKSQKVIEFGPEMQMAEQKIKDCLKKWGKNAHQYIHEVINQVFKADKKGFVNKNAIMGLFTYNITDPDWIAAMELIRKSIQEVTRKEYMMIQTRKDKDAAWVNLNLNFSSLDSDDLPLVDQRKK